MSKIDFITTTSDIVYIGTNGIYNPPNIINIEKRVYICK